MGKKRTEVSVGEGEQLELIDVTPANMKEIVPLVKAYRKATLADSRAKEKRKEAKAALTAAVHEAGLEPLEDGKIRFKCEDMVVLITPQDDSVRVTEDKP